MRFDSVKIKFLLVLFAFLILASIGGYSQVGKTYALVVGVSNYKHPFIKHLNYADDDALAFYGMLKSKAIGVDSTNIHLYIDENATLENIQCSYQWLDGVAKKGDRVIVFFSGHGDAVDPSLIYLLPYGADGSDPNNYEQTALGIFRIKVLLKKLVTRGVLAYFFIDACRSHEYGITDSTQQSENGILNQCNGEIQFVSTSANDYSYEDARWGNGHGVFSFFLIKGWLGMADKDEDGLVTVYELSAYVEENVRKDTRNLVEKRTMQRPQICKDGKDDFILAHVDTSTLRKLKLADQQYVVVDDIFAYATKKHNNFSFLLNPTNQILLDSIICCIKQGRINSTTGKTAKSYYSSFLKTNSKDTFLLVNVRTQLLTILLENGEKFMNAYLNGNPYDYSTRLIQRAEDESQLAMSLVNSFDFTYEFIHSRNLFFKAQRNYCQKNYSLALSYIDSSIYLWPKAAYLYHTRSIIRKQTNQIDSCLADLDRSISLAPNWSLPYCSKADVLILLGRNNEASNTINVMLSRNSKAYNYSLAGDFYFSIDSFEQAKNYYLSAYNLDKSLSRSEIGLAVCNKLLNGTSIKTGNSKLDSSFYLAKNARYYEYVFDFEKAANVYMEMYQLDTTNIENYLQYAECVLNSGNPQISVSIYKNVIKHDKYFSIAYKRLAEFYERRGIYDSAIVYHRKLYNMDRTYNPVNLYLPFKKNGQMDSALVYLNKALHNKTFSTGIYLTETANAQVLEFLRQRKNTEALKLIDSIKTAHLANCETYNLSSIVHYELGNGKIAIGEVSSAITCDPTYDLYYVNLAIYYKKFTNLKDSVIGISLRPYLKFKCDSKPYLANVIYLLSGTTDMDDFRFITELAIKLYPEEPEFYFYMAIYYHIVNGQSKFYTFFEQAIAKGLTKESYQRESYRFDEFLDNDATFQNLKAKIKN